MDLDQFATTGEARVAKNLVETLLDRGYPITIEWLGEDDFAVVESRDRDEILKQMAATGMEYVTAVGGPYFFLVYGNAEDGSELISDYADTPEANEIWEALQCLTS